ncbi:hypothetical protein E4656_19885 [Natronospirillum operosum]|uniref:Uncharacterized protein n=1 Tax=Natronospirillum operosum TaxID=2759953 RepID=A0A4Z0W498_9GAMM|nr:hypothetical protein [Natronospirillum operosum]TGG89399.1 hypothetical protein E4656_19885 [Natronospirillum operosum]
MTIATNGLPSNLLNWVKGNAEAGLPVIDDQVFQQIDQLTNADQVRFSSRAQFLFNIQSHAHTLNEQERDEFVDLLAQVDQPLFDQDLLEYIRNPTVPVFAEPAEMYQSKTGLSDEVPTEPIIVVASAARVFNGGHTSSIGQFNPDSGRLQARFAELSEQAFNELDQQDATTVTETVKHALEYGNRLLNSAESLFHSNYEFARVEHILQSLPVSDALKAGFGELINDARSAQNRMLARYQQAQEQKLTTMPRFRDVLLADIESVAEIISVNTRLQNFLAHPDQDILDAGSYFRRLLDDASYLNKLSEREMERLFDHYAHQRAEDERIFVERDWLGESLPQYVPESYEEEVHQTQELTRQFIDALATYAQVASA